jgi:fumarate hydratase class II
MANAASNLARRCIVELRIDAERAAAAVERSMAMVTALAPAIGYDKAAAIAKTAHQTGRAIREVAREEGLLTEEELERLLDPIRMTEPGVP